MSLDRRGLLVLGGAAAFTGLITTAGRAATLSPFTLGVASGDPAPDGFVIWTRLAMNPLAADGQGGMGAPVDVAWEVADDVLFRRVVQRGRAVAHAGLAHSVHVEVGGLSPARRYWYRFGALGHRSAVGTARTAPARGDSPQALKITVASCSHWEKGWFSAYRHMADERPDLTLFLGDYIYEYSYGAQATNVVRHHDSPDEVKTLQAYRNRYALHRTDPDLQALHAAAPALMTWDDHEVSNDYANRWSQDASVPVETFLQRRAAAYQAFYEHMPLRPQSSPRGPDMRVFDRLRFGDLAEFTVLDGRQYRSIQPCASPTSRRGHVAPDTCAERTDPARTMLGAYQEAWLHEGFRKADARWNIVAQDLLVAPLLQTGPGGVVGHYTDGWDGYPATRERMLKALAEAKTPNPVFLGGDIHSFWTTDLKGDFADPSSPTIATEFVGTSVTSDNPPHDSFAAMLPRNPHVRFMDARQHGYISIDVSPGGMNTRFQAISDRADPKATVRTLAAFAVEAGAPGAKMA